MENREALTIFSTIQKCRNQALHTNDCENCERCQFYHTQEQLDEAVDMAISALEKQTCDGCIFNKRWKEDNCIDCARKAIDKYQRPLPEPYTEEEA